MKKLATLTAAAALMLGFAVAAQAGGGSDTTLGDDANAHCYLFFEDTGDEGDLKDAQAMINGDEDDEVKPKVLEMIAKYGLDSLVETESVGSIDGFDVDPGDDIVEPCRPRDE